MAAPLVDALRGRLVDVTLLAVYLAALLVMGFLLEHRHERSIRCIRATLALSMDAAVRSAREGGLPDADLRERYFNEIKEAALEPRNCPALANLENRRR